MKTAFFRFALPSFLALPLLGAGAAAADERPSCAALARKIQSEVTARPERVLIIVEDTLVVDDACACEVIKAAIGASKATPKLVGQIVFTAVTASPKNAPLIAECAAATSPEASREIKSALTKALGEAPLATRVSAAPSPETPGTSSPQAAPDDKSPGNGKNPPPDKNPPVAPTPTESEADFGLSPVAIGGIYLVYPSTGGPPVIVDQPSRRFITRRPPRQPRVIIVHPPTATASTDPSRD